MSARPAGRMIEKRNEDLDRDLGLSIHGVERDVLSGGFANEQDASLFRGTSSTTEINYTFHRIPSPKTIDNWLTQTPENFRFALKAPQKITHFAKLRDCQDTIAYFYRVVSALGDRLGPVLFQLPPSFKKNADVLSAFLRELPAMRAAFEFRHESWLDEEIFALLRSCNVALCLADTEKMAAPTTVTADYGYLRLRREDYTGADVERWAEFVEKQSASWKETFVYFKHEESGIGPRLASQLVELLR